ncbi:MAG: sigma 54-interacting transcriptional regulator [Thiotrichaceae bacterium]
MLPACCELSDATVLILGESGTGKELLCGRCTNIKHLGLQQPFITVNCAAIPESLRNQNYLDIVRAFTGATEHQQGRMQAADQGTIFLDEIGERL